MKKELIDKIRQLEEFANNADNIIEYHMVIDILQDRNKTINDDDIIEAIEYLEEKGIEIERPCDEDYENETVDSDMYIPADVNINQKSVTVYNLMERLENGEINLAPDFQRNSNLWNLEKQSKLIESLILKIPIPSFYFDATRDDKWIVIDGLQRLTSFENYLVGIDNDKGKKVKKKFCGFQYFKELNGLTFDELPRQYVRRIKETQLIAYTVEQGTPERVVYDIFKRINTGGVSLKPQEIRNALYQGESTSLIKELADSKEFLLATQNAVSKARMVDQEYVLRYIAFTQLDYKEDYKGNIDNFLISAMKKVNDMDQQQIDNIKKEFFRVMKNCNKIFDKYAFRKYTQDGRRGPINKALFEMWSVIFYKYSDEKLEMLINNKMSFLERFCELLSEKEFSTKLKSGDQYSVAKRIEIAEKFVEEFI